MFTCGAAASDDSADGVSGVASAGVGPAGAPCAVTSTGASGAGVADSTGVCSADSSAAVWSSSFFFRENSPMRPA